MPAVFKYHIDSKRYYNKDENFDKNSWIPKPEQKEISFKAKDVEINDNDFLDADGFSKISDNEVPF
jgi:hypothetical protein